MSKRERRLRAIARLMNRWERDLEWILAVGAIDSFVHQIGGQKEADMERKVKAEGMAANHYRKKIMRLSLLKAFVRLGLA